MEAIIFAGVQGAGKSTFYCRHFFRTHVRINLDMLRTRRREDMLLACCLQMGQRFVVDNTNRTVAERAKYIRAAREAHFRVIGYLFETDLETCLRRNESRAPHERIPPKGIVGTYRRFERPTVDEGFDELFLVRTGDGGEAHVEALKAGQ